MTQSRPSRGVVRGERGFTLLETLVALSILSLSIPVLFGIFSGGLERTLEDRRALHARALAQSLLAGAQAVVPSKSRSGRDASGFNWVLTVSGVPGAGQTGTFPETISATISWISGGERRTLTLFTAIAASVPSP